ncbi:MAG: GntR family transcriptional regulator [Deinococcota bacterium]
MDLNILVDNPIPIGEQLKSQLRHLIETNKLEPSQQLLTVKELAKSLNLNYNTVAAAYRALEQEGYLVQNRRAGTRVADAPPRPLENVLLNHLGSRVAQEIKHHDLNVGDVLKTITTQVALDTQAQPLRVAVLAPSPLDAQQAAERTGSILGDDFTCIPMTPDHYSSADYHLTVVDPVLANALRATADVIPTSTQTDSWYSHEFPAGAD